MKAFQLGEIHDFEVGGKRYLFSVTSLAIAELDEISSALINYLKQKKRASPEDVFHSLGGRYPVEELGSVLEELGEVGVLVPAERPPVGRGIVLPPLPFPIRTLVLNVSARCNLSCGYCYAGGGNYGGPQTLMSREIARKSVDFLLAHSGDNGKVTLSFFGGEAFLNFPVMKATVEYGRRQAAKLGKTIDFTVTTNGTLLSRNVVRYLNDHEIGVTVSLDGPKEINDRMRSSSDGRGSYDLVSPRVSYLIKHHRTRPVAARATLYRGSLDVQTIFWHLLGMGFAEVGLAPVTLSAEEECALSEDELWTVLSEFAELAEIYVEKVEQGEYLGFSNLSNLLEELHRGAARPYYPCGAGLALLAVGVTGEIYVCHRLSGLGEYALGHVDRGIDLDRQEKFLEQAHLGRKGECRDCWIRNFCAGGCYHEAYVRFGDGFHPNTHYCRWLRSWIALGLQVYVRIMEENPGFMDFIERREGK